MLNSKHSLTGLLGRGKKDEMLLGKEASEMRERLIDAVVVIPLLPAAACRKDERCPLLRAEHVFGAFLFSDHYLNFPQNLRCLLLYLL